jgi:O-antigen/teichoic acid export membrane protein
MTDASPAGQLSAAAAGAMRWRALQLGGVQAINFLRLLILAKLLAPEAFGLLAIATIAIGVFMRLSDVGMIPALVQREHVTPEQRDGAWTVGLLRAALVAAVLFFAAPTVALLFNEPLAAPIIQALALRPLVEAAASIGIARLTRELRFRELAIVYVPGAVVDLCVAVALAPTLGVWALVAGALAGSATTVVLSYVLAPHRPRLSLRWAEIAPLVDYGRWVLAAGIVSLAGTLLTQLAISRMLGSAALGLFFLAAKVAYLPIEAASAVIAAVAFPMFARLKDDLRRTTEAFAGLLGGMFLLLLPVYALVFALAPLLEQALGERWMGTAAIVQILAVAAGITSILGELCAPLLMGRGRADQAFHLEWVQTGGLLLALWPSLLWLGLPGAPVAWVVGNALSMLLAFALVRRLLPGAMAAAAPRMAAAAVAGLVAGAVAWGVSHGLDGLLGLCLAGSAGVAVAVAVLWSLNRPLGLELSQAMALVTKRASP